MEKTEEGRVKWTPRRRFLRSSRRQLALASAPIGQLAAAVFAEGECGDVVGDERRVGGGAVAGCTPRDISECRPARRTLAVRFGPTF